MSKLVFDLETTGLCPIKDKIVGVGFKWCDQDIEYSSDPGLPYFLADEYVGHNVKFDLEFLTTHNQPWNKEAIIFDTMVAEWMLHPDQNKYNLKYLAKKYFDIEYTTFSQLINKHKPKGTKKRDCNITVVPVGEIEKYCKMDIEVTHKLYELLKPKIIDAGLWSLFQMEMKFLKVLINIELAGISVSESSLKVLTLELDRKIEKVQEHLPKDININSPQQLSEYLFKTLGLPTEGIKGSLRVTKGKGAIFYHKTDDETLTKLEGKHEVIQHLKEYRKLNKMRSTYTKALVDHIKVDRKIHTAFNQARTATGRLSSDKPNLQNIPKQKDVRAVFTASEDHILLSADYSQAELWIMAYLADDKQMKKDLQDGKDVYRETAKDTFKDQEITDKMREETKSVVLGLDYGMTKWGLAKQLNIDEDEAQRRTNVYFRRYSGVSRFIKFSPILAEQKGYTFTLLNRKRPYAAMKEKYQKKSLIARRCINTPIQGTCADFMKLAMIDIQDCLDSFKLKSKMVLQVHDEVMLDVHKDELDLVKEIVLKSMDVCKNYGIPIPVGLKVGPNWGNMKEIK